MNPHTNWKKRGGEIDGYKERLRFNKINKNTIQKYKLFTSGKNENFYKK